MFEKKLYVPAKHKDQMQAVIDSCADFGHAFSAEQLRGIVEKVEQEPVDQVNALFDILVKHMGMFDNDHVRYEFVERFSEDTPQESWFSGVGGTGWKLWFDSMNLSFRVAHESNMVIHPKNVNAANAALAARTWLFLND